MTWQEKNDMPLHFHADRSKSCERCGSLEGVQPEDSRTAYTPKVLTAYERLTLEDPLEGAPDPNAPTWLCRHCAKEHHEFWDDMWSQLGK